MDRQNLAPDLLDAPGGHRASVCISAGLSSALGRNDRGEAKAVSQCRRTPSRTALGRDIVGCRIVRGRRVARRSGLIAFLEAFGSCAMAESPFAAYEGREPPGMDPGRIVPSEQTGRTVINDNPHKSFGKRRHRKRDDIS